MSRLQQAEHEAVAIFLVERTGAGTPDVVAMTSTDRGDAVLVLEAAVRTLRSLLQWDEAHLVAAWHQLASLRAAGVAHGALDATTLEVDANGDVVVDQLDDRHRQCSRPSMLHRDVAALLTLTALSVGADAAIPIAVAGRSVRTSWPRRCRTSSPRP